jgi:hypothetical protein
MEYTIDLQLLSMFDYMKSGVHSRPIDYPGRAFPVLKEITFHVSGEIVQIWRTHMMFYQGRTRINTFIHSYIYIRMSWIFFMQISQQFQRQFLPRGCGLSLLMMGPRHESFDFKVEILHPMMSQLAGNPTFEISGEVIPHLALD